MHFFKIIIIALCACVCAPFAFCQSAEGMVGRDAPATFHWGEPKDSDLAFRFVVLDGKKAAYYVRKNDFFAPVSISQNRAPGSMYSVAKASELVLYNRVEDPALPQGSARYIPVATVPTGGSSDLLIGVYFRDGKPVFRPFDISLSAFPIGTFSVINMSPQTMGFQVGKSAFKVASFGTTTRNVNARRDVLELDLDIYDLAGKSPQLRGNRTITFRPHSRAIMITFALPKIEKRTPIYGYIDAAPDGKATSDQSSSGSSMSDFYMMISKTPR